MRGKDLREFIVGLESRFPDFDATRSSYILGSIERDKANDDLTFYEVLSVLNAIWGHGDMGIELQHYTPESERELLKRVDDLQSELAEKNRKWKQCQERLDQTRQELEKISLQKSVSSDEMERFKILQKNADGDIQSLQRLASYVPKLLNVLEVVSEDRNNLYNLHLQVINGGAKGTTEIKRRKGLEKELGQVYTELLQNGKSFHFSSPMFEENVVMNRSKSFVFFSLLMYVLGLLSAFFIRDYFISSDLFVGVPPFSVY